MKAIPLFGTERALPRQVGALEFQDVSHFDDERLGVQVRYGSPEGTKADVYLYDLGVPNIPDDLGAPEVMEFFQMSCRDVLAAAHQGVLLDFELKTSQYLFLPDDAPAPLYLWAAFYYRQAPGPFTVLEGMRYSHLALRTDRGYINKVRYTYPETLAADAGLGLAAFLLEWHHLVVSARPAGAS